MQEARSERSELLVNLLILAGIVVVAILRWDVFSVPVTFVVTLGLLVAIHEWGHFIAAKAVGVHVSEFALGFGPKLMTLWRRSGTEYTIRALPLGGFVNPKGMQPDDPITPDGLNGRRPAERALVYLAGPLMNVILGTAVLLCMGAVFGVPDESKVLVGDVVRKSAASKMEVLSQDGQPAAKAQRGLRVGDRVLEVNGKAATSMEVVTSEIHRNAGKPVELTVQRGEQKLRLRGVPEAKEAESKFLVVTGVPEGTQLDIRPGDQISQINGAFPGTAKEEPDAATRRLFRENAGKPITVSLWRNSKDFLEITGPAAPVEVAIQDGKRTFGALGFSPVAGSGPRISWRESITQGLERTVTVFQSLLALFSKPKQLGESVGGVIAIWNVLGQVGKLPLVYYFMVVAQLSISLAVFNMLPIPILDGGHLGLLTWEVLRRRRLEPELQKRAAMVGFAIIGVIFVLIMSKDIMRYFG